MEPCVIPKFLQKSPDLQGFQQLLRNNYFLGIILARAAPADDIHRRQLRPVQSGDVPNVEHLREMMLRYLDGEGLNLAGPQRSDALTHGGQREAANAVKQASHRRHMLRIVPFRAGTQSHSLRCSASPHATRFAGLARGPRHCSGHFTAWTMVRVVLTAAWAV